jgi:YDG domain/Bacterial Ig-like domain (group 3)/Galactose oxidase, central domain/MBG domain (YGX type)/Kelch motif
MIRLFRFALPVCFAVLFHVNQLQAAAASAHWAQPGSLVEARSGSAAAVLSDGRVLITGGTGSSGPLATTEFFNTDGSFSAGAPMQDARANHTAVVLQDGRVLVAGGTTTGGAITNTAEIYDPSSNKWTLIGSGMAQLRSGHSASLLSDGRVLIAGGQNTSGPANTLETFSPSTNSFTLVTSGTLASPRTQHAAAVLADGRVLIAGGSDGTNALKSADIFDPSSGNVSPAASMSMPRAGLSATTLLDGTVIVAGGNDGSADLASAEKYDPAAGTFSPTGNLSAARSGHLAFLLPNNNQVLIAGGTSAGTPLASAELFVPWTSTFNSTGAMAVARTTAAASPLKQNGQLLVAGGSDGKNPLASSELYNFATITTDKSDYPPGTTVNISGSGWQPGETVTLTLVESPLFDTHGPYSAVADSNGNILNNQFATDEHDANIRFYLTAKGSVSQAQMTFTDSTHLQSLTVGAQAGSLTAGSVGSVTYPITVGFNGNGACTVNLSVTTTLPAAVQYSFSPSSLTGGATQTLSSTLTITTSSLTPAGTTGFTVTVQGTGGKTNDCASTDSISSPTPLPTLVIGTAVATPVITWNNPADITYGTPLSSTQLNATASVGGTTVPGSFTYSPAAGTVLSAGKNQTLSVTFTPTDTTKYKTATSTVQINVNQATPAITWANPAAITYGTALGAAQLNAISSVQGTFSYAPAAGAILNAGSQNLSVTFTPADAANYSTATKAVQINVTQAASIVAWPQPADISYGTALSGTQLNATANVPGTFVYNPPAGTVLNTGNGQTLSVTFTPNDTADYTPAMGSVQINVLAATPGVTNSGPGTSTYGTNVTLSVTLSAPAGAETPTGTVQFQFSNNGTTYNICPNGSLQSQPAGSPCAITLNNGTATVTTSSLPAGTTPDSITATYKPADSNYNSATTTITYTVNTASTQTGISIKPDAGATYGDTVTLSSTVTNTAQGSTGTPTGTVQFQYRTDGGTTWANIGDPVTLDTSGNAQTTTTALPAGQPAIRAEYIPDSNFAASNSAPLAYRIDQKSLTVSGITASNKPYDGKTAATVDTSNAQLVGVIGNDDVHLSATGATGTFEDANVSTGKTVTVNGLSLTGTAKSNYTLSQATATANIAAVQVAVTAPSLTVTYGAPTPAPLPAPTYSTFVNGEDNSVLTTQPTCTTTYTQGSPAGSSQTTSCSGAVAMNYTFTYVNGTVKVDKADAKISVTPYSVTYDAKAHTATGTATGVNGESLSGLDLSKTTHTDAGTYANDAWTFTDATGNYNNTTGTVNDAIAKAEAKVTVTGGTYTYDTTAHPATATITGVQGDSSLTAAMVTLSYTPGEAVAPVNAGAYKATGTFAGNLNYNPATGSDTITINKADAKVTVTPYSVTYDGTAHTATGTATGVKGEALNGVDLSATTHTNAGTTNDPWTFTDATGNYNNTSGTVSDAIAKANVTVMVTGGTFTYNASAHPATATISGVMGDMSLNPSMVTLSYDPGGTAPINAGTYQVAGSFAGNSNYNPASGTATITINKATPTLTVTGGTYTYDANPHPGTATIMGVQGDNSLASLVTLAYTPGGTAPVNAGSYSVTGSFPGTANYNPVTSVSATISINQASASISVQGYTGPYDGSAHGATGSAVGVVGENLSGLLNLGGNFIHVPGGTVNWTFAGSNNYKPAGGTAVISFYAASTATALTSGLAQPNGTATLTLTATVSSPAPLVGGSLTFTDASNNNAVLGTSGLTSGKGSITIPAASLSTGPHLISATYVPASLDFAGSGSTPNSAPGVTITDPSSGYVSALNSSVKFSATLSGVSGVASPSAEWTFTNTGTQAVTNGIGTISGATITGSNTFASAGVFGITLTFTDGLGDVVITKTVCAPGAPSDLPAILVIYDPSAGFVTGGGWINSPAGAYTPNPSLTGKATFGFVSKYQKGATIPTGDTQFTFQVGKLDFHSTSYQWLVVSGPMAQYKGSGTINGSGSYEFMLTGRDGGQVGNNTSDGFRIKITDPSTGTVVYDNLVSTSDAMTTANTQSLDGGSVIVHSK